MQSNISNILNRYDLSAKTFPGIVFLLGLVTVLPRDLFSEEIGLTSIIAALSVLVIIILGFVIGQGLHSSAIRIEDGIYTLGRAYYIVNKSMSLFLAEHTRYSRTRTDDVELNLKDYLLFFSLPITTVIILTLTKNYWFTIFFLIFLFFTIISSNRVVNRWVRETFMSHRKLFKNYIKRNIYQVDEFKNRLSNQYEWIEEDEEDSMYTAAISHQSFLKIGRAYQFQSTFAFCRGMWQVFIFYSLIYFFVLADTNTPDLLPSYVTELIIQISNYEPLLSSYFKGDTVLILLGCVCLLLGLLFMEAERQYKQWYIEYLIVDYLVADTVDVTV